MSDSRPADGKSTDVKVKTASRASVVAVAYFKSGKVRRTGRAGVSGYARLVFHVGKAKYGYKVVVKVTVRKGSHVGHCSTSFTPTRPAPKVHGIASCRSSGDFATCVESGNATKPVTIWVHVSAKPNQSVFVTWDDVCSLGLSAASESGQFTATTPIKRKIKHPFKHPDSCTVAADGSLNGSGSLHVWTNYVR